MNSLDDSTDKQLQQRKSNIVQNLHLTVNQIFSKNTLLKSVHFRTVGVRFRTLVKKLKVTNHPSPVTKISIPKNLHLRYLFYLSDFFEAFQV
jgi:hypothetical protein